MAGTEHRAAERVVRGDRAIGPNPQDLARQARAVGRRFGAARVARRDPQVATRVEGEASSLMTEARADAVQDHASHHEGLPVGAEFEGHHRVVARGRVVGVDCPAGHEPRRHRQVRKTAHQSDPDSHFRQEGLSGQNSFLPKTYRSQAKPRRARSAIVAGDAFARDTRIAANGASRLRVPISRGAAERLPVDVPAAPSCADLRPPSARARTGKILAKARDPMPAFAQEGHDADIAVGPAPPGRRLLSPSWGTPFRRPRRCPRSRPPPSGISRSPRERRTRERVPPSAGREPAAPGVPEATHGLASAELAMATWRAAGSARPAAIFRAPAAARRAVAKQACSR